MNTFQPSRFPREPFRLCHPCLLIHFLFADLDPYRSYALLPCFSDPVTEPRRCLTHPSGILLRLLLYYMCFADQHFITPTLQVDWRMWLRLMFLYNSVNELFPLMFTAELAGKL